VVLFLFFTNLYSNVNILVYPQNLYPDGFGDRAAQLMMIYNIKRTLSLQSTVYLYLNKEELDQKKFDKLLGFDIKNNKEYFVKMDMKTLSFVLDKDNADFIVLTNKESMQSKNYAISFCFSNTIERFIQKTFDSSVPANVSEVVTYCNDSLIKKLTDEKKPAHKNQLTLQSITKMPNHANVSLYIFPEVNEPTFYSDWPNFKPSDYNVFPNVSNAFYFSEKSLLPSDDIVVDKSSFLPEEYKNISDPIFLASYFNNSYSSENINFNTFFYFINIYKEMSLDKNYVWFHNSVFETKEDLQIFFEEHSAKYLEKGIIQEKEQEEIKNFLKTVKLTLINRALNLIEHAVLSKIADFPVGCTGEISFTLALRYSQYRPIYEFPSWKEIFFLNHFFPSFKVAYIYSGLYSLCEFPNLSFKPKTTHYRQERIEINSFRKSLENKKKTFTEFIINLIEEEVDKNNS